MALKLPRRAALSPSALPSDSTPVWEPLPASGVCAEAVRTVGEKGQARVFDGPFPGARSRNPLHQGAPGGGREVTGRRAPEQGGRQEGARGGRAEQSRARRPVGRPRLRATLGRPAAGATPPCRG
ncbi:translation initiation factor IF-2-like [Panthera tigris]|uniref:translation initiation factor IF-2-like n=1 Tax=Panthera tigris TaxID=9694 RepID=UPI001C6F6356|nr:translation initiation factor IF-2-like [Panthera tigris]